MSDLTPLPSPEIKQSRTVGKSSGAKDVKSLKHNPNRDLEAPDIPDAEKEREIAKRLGGRQHGAHQPRTIERVLKLAGQGYSPYQMHRSFRGIPHPDTIYRWMDEEPDFGEAFKTRQRHYIDDETRQVLPTVSAWKKDARRLRSMLRKAKDLSTIEGLKPFEQVQARDRAIQRATDLLTSAVLVEDKGAHRTLQIAARQLPQDWGERAEGESNVVVIDVSQATLFKTLNLPGSPEGQNAKALESGKWGQKALPSPEEVGGEK